MILLRFLFTLLASAIFTGIIAQEAPVDKTYKPHSGQEGKDVVWVPSPDKQVESMLNLANVTSKDFVIDLGSGDGRTVIAAAKRGAKARGVEFEPNLVELSRKTATKEGVSDRAEFIVGDLYEADLSDATVITLFLLPEINMKLRPSLLELKPGTRIVSNTFQMEEWIPDSTVRTEEECQFWCDAYLWIIPSKANGIWKTGEGELRLDQSFQRISGTLNTGKKTIKISEGKLAGNKISFMIKKRKYSGFINGNKAEGLVASGKETKIWKAEKRE